jgi:uncharacterized membrane protein
MHTMEWTRADLKTRAKQYLKTRYWYALLVLFIVGAISGVASSAFSGISSIFTSAMNLADFGATGPSEVFSVGFLLMMGTLSCALSIGMYAFVFFVTGPLAIGASRWFVRTRMGEPPSKLGHVFGMFKKGDYRGSVGGYAWMSLWVFLWTIPYVVFMIPAILVSYFFLFEGIFSFVKAMAARSGQAIDPADLPDLRTLLNGIGIPSTAVLLGILAIFLALMVVALIPMIYKQISYSMTPWILSDNPRIGYRRALTLSMAMTKGNVLAMFVLSLSWIGWSLLSLLPMICCIPLGPFFLAPYIKATESELYAVLKHGAILRGDCTVEELGYAPAPSPTPMLESAPAEEGTPA